MHLHDRVHANLHGTRLDRSDKVIDRGGGQFSALCPSHEALRDFITVSEAEAS